MKKKILLGVLVVLVAIQFIRPAKNLGAAEPGPNDITVLHPTSLEVKAILARACYDCHSDRTRYPWYAEVQPVGWWLAWHVKEGKRHLNFSQFGVYPGTRASRKLTQLMEETKDEGMPLPSYTWIHRDAKLTDAQIATVCDWAEALQEKIAPEK